MIKTFNINLAGQIFNINEDAYEQLSAYFNSLRAFYANESDKDEIIRDIEARFAELFLAKGKNYIVTKEDATTVINLMGNPQEFDEENSQNNSNNTSNNNSNTKTEFTNQVGGKKLYRDFDNGLITGVCAGLSAYFGINDAIWLRLLFIGLTIIGFGSPIIVYIVLSLIMPKAETAAQKLEMKGEPINLSNIVKNINEEQIDVKSKGFFNRIIAFFGAGIMLFFKALLWIGIACAILIGSIVIISLLITLVVISCLALFGIPVANTYFFTNTSDGWFFGIGALLACIIPIIFSILAIVHVLSKTLKPLNKKTLFPLLGLFLFGILLLNISGYNAKKLVQEKKKIIQSYPLNYAYQSDTLQIAMNPEIQDEDYDNININGVSDLLEFVSDHEDNLFPVEIEVYPSRNDSFFVVKEYAANGKDMKDAVINATSFKHNIRQVNNKLLIDPYIQFDDNKIKYRNQKLKIKVYVPEGKVIRWDERTEGYMNMGKIAINWEPIRNGSTIIPPVPPLPPLPPTATKSSHKVVIKNGDTSSSSKIIINIEDDNGDITEALDKAQEKLDAARERLEDANIRLDDSMQEIFENRLSREHYIFKMVNGELVAID